MTSIPTRASTTLALAALLAIVLPGVAGHGYVHWVNTGGQVYTGWLPFTDPYADPIPDRVIRKIPSDGPITDISSQDLACNSDGETGTKAMATAAAGSSVTFEWENWLSDHLGPVSSYMTSCNNDCSSFNVKGAMWFKIDAAGYDQSTNTWASSELIANNASWTSTIPKNLASGEYLIRHEIVALHSTGQPQYYPSCLQISVTNGGDGVPSGNDLVAIPGLYDNTQWPDIWGNFGSFAIPGPSIVFTDSAGSSTGLSADSGASATATAAGTASASTSKKSGGKATSTASADPGTRTAGKGQCRVKRSSTPKKRHFPARMSWSH